MHWPSLPLDPDALREWTARDAGAQVSPSQPSRSPRAQSRRASRYPPWALAALCYLVPFIPGGLLLWRERHNQFIRLHAAQSIVFFALVALCQIVLYTLLVVAGGLITNDTLAFLAGVTVTLLFLAEALFVLLVWLRLVTDCLDGRARLLPVVGSWVMRLARFSSRAD